MSGLWLSRIHFPRHQGIGAGLDSATGAEVWSKKLRGDGFVNVVLDGSNLFAATRGEMFCLDPQTGIIRWHNPLRGYGWGLVSITAAGLGANPLPLLAEKRPRDEAASSAAGTSVATG